MQHRTCRYRPRDVLTLASRLAMMATFFLAAPHARAQTPSEAPGAASGVVSDATGARLAGARLTLRRQTSGLRLIITSAPDGTVTLPATSGRFELTVSAPGFAPLTRLVELPLRAPLNLTLHPAPIVEQVTVVSASRQEELRETLSTRVDVISRERIRDSGAQTVGELLREVPGVLSRRHSEGAGASGEQIQGIDSRQVLVLFDGQPLVGARGIKSGVLNLDRQAAGTLERVEVVKGASSALYGSDAIGGVINLIPRDAERPLSLGGELSGGSLGERNAAGEIGVRSAGWTGHLSAERHQQDGFDLTPTTFDTTAAPFARIDYVGRVRGRVAPAIAVSSFVAGYDNHSTGRAIGELGPQEDEIDERTLNVNGALDWQPGAATTAQFRAYHALYRERSAGRLASPEPAPLPPGALDEDLLKLDASVSRVIGSRQHVQAGLEYWRDEYSGTNRMRTDTGERSSTRVGWAQYRVSAGDRVVATLGGRVDNHSAFGSAFSPKAAANVRIADGVHLRASVGRGFRAPDLGQLFYRFMNPSNLYQVIGNPALQPEYATSIQVGGELTTPGRRARLGVNLFRNDVRDLINSVSLGFVATQAQLTAILEREGLDPTFRPVPGRLLFTYRNVAEAVTEGVELDAEWAVVRGLSLAGAYTALDARDDVTGLPLTGRHAHQGHVRLGWSSDRVGFRANVRGSFYSSWISARALVSGVARDTRAPGFALWDAFASQRIGRAITAFAAVDNLTGSQDPEIGRMTESGAPASLSRLDVGRTARVGVRLSWAR